VDIELTYVGFRAHVKIASRIVSYRLLANPNSLVAVSKGTRTVELCTNKIL